MISIGFGQNIIDHYFYGGQYIGSSSGGSAWNIISNIASLGGKVVALGMITGDYGGDIFIEEMKNLGIDISHMDIKKRLKSNAMFIEVPSNYDHNNEVKANYKCPICGKAHWKTRKVFEKFDFSFLEEQEVLLIIDNIKSDNIEIIKKLKEKSKVLIVAQDLGHKYNLRFKKGYELREYFSNIDVLQIKKEVIEFLLKRMDMTIEEFLRECNLLKIIVTNGNEGCCICECVQDEYLEKRYYPSKKYNVVDSSGAGDVFLARYLYKTYISKEIENECFEFCQEGVERVLAGVGAKFNLGIQLKNIESRERCNCICLDRTVRTNKANNNLKFKCLANYEAVKKRIHELQVSGSDEFEKVLNQERTVICVGTGASYISAIYVSQLLLSLGKMAIAIYPYEITKFRYVNIGEILIFTTSGKTYDNRKLAEECCGLFRNVAIRLVTTADKETLIENYPLEVINNSIIYKSNFLYQEHGFLSFWGVFGPVVYLTLLAKRDKDVCLYDLKIIEQRFSYWDNNDGISKCMDLLLEKKCKTIDVIYSSQYKAAAIAMESMFTESGICRCLIHEEKNFSHGRFVISEHIPSDCVVIIKNIKTTEYEKRLIEYFQNQGCLLWILEAETMYSEIDAIIAVYSWMVQYSLRLNRDISKPEYTNDSMKLYKYK